jgi:hypothetical protein
MILFGKSRIAAKTGERQFWVSVTTLIAVVGMALAATALAADLQFQEQPGEAVVHTLRGSAEYKEAGKEWAAVKVGTNLKAGGIIKTSVNGQVDLFLGRNGPVVRVSPESEMKVEKLTATKTRNETVIETLFHLKFSNKKMLKL